MKAIETRYKGYRFRSRLEARWAVFFDALPIRWEYEPEGFETQAGWYLPDFYLPQLNVYAEVKPNRLDKEIDTKDWEKMQAFVFEIETTLILLEGVPSAERYSGIFCETSSSEKFIEEYLFCWHEAYLPPFNRDGSPRLYWWPDQAEAEDRTPMRAINAARSARFEHGESG